jgi:hypothetical protein
MLKLVAAASVAAALIAITAGALPASSAKRPEAHASRTCADYPNQRQAQLHRDTRDADGDGIYCESLPCPCLKPSQPSHGVTPSPPAGHLPAFFEGRCKRGPLPDYSCTPGAVFANVTARDICTPGYSKRVRNVTASLKQRVYASYGIRRHAPYAYEVDHLVSLELGGSNSQRNLWPERQPGARSKDKIENALHAQLCDHVISVRRAQAEIRRWTHMRLNRH